MARITLFRHAEHQGSSLELREGMHQLMDEINPNIGVPKCSLSSYVIGPWTEVIFRGGWGRNYGISDSNYSFSDKAVSYIGDDWNDEVTSVEVKDIPIPMFGETTIRIRTEANLSGVILFQDYDFSPVSAGMFESLAHQKFGVGTHILPVNFSSGLAGPVGTRTYFRHGLPPKTAKSMQIGRQYYAHIFDESGARHEVKESISDLQTIGWFNRITKLTVYDTNPR
jgi:hypothetical protein